MTFKVLLPRVGSIVALMAVLLTPSLSHAVAPPILTLSLDEASGSVAYDTSGNGLNGSLLYGAEFATGKVENGILLSGGTSSTNGDRVVVPDIALLNFNGKNFTVACYTKDISDSGWTLAKGKGALTGWGIQNGAFRISDGDGPDTAASFGAIGSGAWIHLAATVDVTNRVVKSYRDGHLIQSVAISTNVNLNAINYPEPFIVGARQLGIEPFFTGMIDEVNLWDVALTQEEIQTLLVTNPPASATTIEYVATDEEFVGPFPSWKNVVTDYGAVGDGIADDTAALQAAFDDLKGIETNDHSVLYFPAGTYRITSTLQMNRETDLEYMGANVVGESPATTTIVWDGPDNDSMLYLNCWYFKISRIALEGNGSAYAGIYRGGLFSTFNEISDMVFSDLRYGIALGGPNGQAEHSILRCRFTRCWEAGVVTTDWNSLDAWVWDCLFEDCYRGCYTESGNYHAFRSVFLRSKGADLSTVNLGFFSAIGNTSIGSACFIDWSPTWSHSWGSQMLIKDNRVYDVCGDWAIRLSNGGPFALMDNQIKNRDGDTTPSVQLAWGDNFLLGNTYTVTNPVSTDGQYRIVDQTIVEPSALPTPAAVQLPRTPPKVARTIFEVQQNTGNDAAAIQLQIDAAANELYGSRPVVHVPQGEYQISRTLIVPAGRDIQLIGDGGGAYNGSKLIWNGPAGGVVIQFDGPSRARMSDFALDGVDNADCLHIDNADQTGGRVHANQLHTQGHNWSVSPANAIFIDGVEETDITLLNNHAQSYCDVGIRVEGGIRQQAGLPTDGQVSIVAGATVTARNHLYSVSKGGRVCVQSHYQEIDGYYNPAPTAFELNDHGSLTIAGSKLTYYANASIPTYMVDGNNGNLTMLADMLVRPDGDGAGDAPCQRISMTGDGSDMRVAMLASMLRVDRRQSDSNYVDAAYVFQDETSPEGDNAMLLCNMNAVPGTGILPWDSAFGRLDTVYQKVVGDTPSDQYLRDALADLRALRCEQPNERPAGVTDVKLHRIHCEARLGRTVVRIQATVPDLVITNPAVASIDVSTNTTSHDLQGVADANRWSGLIWSNALTGLNGVLPAEYYWTISGIGLESGSNVITVSATNTPPTGAADTGANAAYDSGWTNGSSGGTGWVGGWSLVDSTNSGLFIASAGNVNNDAGTRAFGLYASGGAYASASRALAVPMAIGQEFHLRFDNNWIQNGASVGFGLQNDAGDNLFEFFFIGGESSYSINDNSTGRDTGIPWFGAGEDLTFVLTDRSHYSFSVGASNRTGELIGAADKSISRFRAWNSGAGGSSDYDFFINDITLDAGSGAGPMTSAVVTIVRPISSAIPQAWRDQYSLTGENSGDLEDKDGDGVTNLKEYWSATDPTNALSFFNVRNIPSWNRTNGIQSIVIEVVPTTNSRLYDVSYTKNQVGNVWTPFGYDLVGSDTGGVLSITVTNNNSDAILYYRGHVKLP